MIQSSPYPSRPEDRQARMLGWVAIFLLGTGLLFGGGTRAHVFSDLIVQLAGVAALALALIKLDWYFLPTERRQLLMLALAVVGVGLLQLVPIPASLWASFPGRDELAAQRAELGLAEPALRAWSTDSNATWASLRALIPALALLILGVQLQEFWRQRLLGTILVVALVSVPIGLAQIVQGPSSELRFYVPTNNQQAVGLFANRNHYAALLYVGLALSLGAFLTYDRHLRERFTAKGVMQASGWTLLGAFLMVGLMLSRSRAGVGLALLVAALMLVLGFWRRRQHPRTFRWLLGLLGLGGLFALHFGFEAFSSRLQSDWLDQSRWQVTQATLGLASDYAWLGTGLGSFPAAYAAFEPIDLLGDKIINHAHNDWAELLVDLGAVFVLLVLALFAWLLARLVVLLRSAQEQPIAPMTVASAAALLALLVHSAVDYPLRTTAMSMVWVALMLQLLPNLPHDPAERRRRRRRSRQIENHPAAADRPLRERLQVVEGGQARKGGEDDGDPYGWD